MSKHNSLIELVATDKKRKSEFKIKAQQYLLLPILLLNYFISYSPMKFPKSSTDCNISLFKKQVSEDGKFMAIKNDVYSVLSIDELRSIKITEKSYRSEAIIFLAVCSNCGCDINSHDELNFCSTVGCLFKLCFKK